MTEQTTTIIDQLFLELSQFTKAKTAKESTLAARLLSVSERRALREALGMYLNSGCAGCDFDIAARMLLGLIDAERIHIKQSVD